MKILFNLMAAAVLTVSLSCNSVPKDQNADTGKTEKKSENNKSFTGTIVRNCTGTYIRVNEKDWHVCNFELLKNYKEGIRLSVTYEIPEDCPEFNGIAVCMMYHPHEGLIRILGIKR